MKKIVYLILILIVACKSKTQSKQGSNFVGNGDANSSISDFKLHDEDNFKDVRKSFNFLGESFLGTKKTVFINNMFYSASILPKEYYIKKHLKKTDSLDTYLKKLKKEEVIQFDFQYFKGDDLFKDKSAEEVEELVKYLSFNIKNDFYAITQKGDTIHTSGVLFERTFKVTPYKRLLLYFKFPQEQEKMKLVYYGKVFDNQIVKFLLEK
ncbi:hypothetical protein SAMN04489761_3349 [Tenacibaculum sp. MAR_2009_124]|uniref:hypothetical protein n=1 Tax=Tenacibaculum sp. MAR_2009_124 TaxID=1250059 RepID=UPI000898AE87|nr:hypothetical protein [Tenacibaculum sp. MAR_2009_124]SEC56830.1 hypothetical protein SAMN04489761_3349 [Tenacibaculum sp. MAR_2009_124]